MSISFDEIKTVTSIDYFDITDFSVLENILPQYSIKETYIILFIWIYGFQKDKDLSIKELVKHVYKEEFEQYKMISSIWECSLTIHMDVLLKESEKQIFDNSKLYMFLNPLLKRNIEENIFQKKDQKQEEFSLNTLLLASKDIVELLSYFSLFKFDNSLYQNIYIRNLLDDIYDKWATSTLSSAKWIQKKVPKFSYLEKCFFLLMIYQVMIVHESYFETVEDLFDALLCTPEEILQVISFFNAKHVFVKEGFVEAKDFDHLEPEEETSLSIFGNPDTIFLIRNRFFEFLKASGASKKRKSKNANTQKNFTIGEKSKARDLYEIVVPKVNLSNVILDKDIRDELGEVLELTKTLDILEEWKIKPTMNAVSSRSVKVLLYGNSGTGKTLTIEALAGEADALLFKVDASNIITSFVGESAKNVKKLFHEFYSFQKESKKEVFLFFNEADQLLSRRGDAIQAADKEYNQVQNLLLEEIENFNGVFLATTNLINVFDSAWNRRFNMKIKFGIPSFDTRYKLWKLHMPKTLPLSDDVDLSKLAEYKFSGGSIANIVYNTARKVALRKKEDRIFHQADFLKSIQREMKTKLGNESTLVGF